ncbi:hypothetical protein [Pseudonocardia sp. H11422]|uniref:hypothetical protein n=1 Tax=Pseudonocardia sp. H11422 TaxID=2835866 RepID=UPI001BDC6B05|nr:hypothetical protein [Pseudonocardia sp. H11422]
MGSTEVWVQTLADGLIRADRIVGIDVHPTPEIAGKASRWLLDVVLGCRWAAGSVTGG